MSNYTAAGIVTIPSHNTLNETVETLKAMLTSKSVTLFAIVDHSAEAHKAGLSMPPTKLLIFGSPAAGTPLMLASPSIALDLPLKILVAEDGEGKVSLSFNSAEYLQQRHGLSDDHVRTLQATEALATAAAQSAPMTR